MDKPHDPSPQEMDERFSLYGLDLEEAVGRLLVVPATDTGNSPTG